MRILVSGVSLFLLTIFSFADAKVFDAASLGPTEHMRPVVERAKVILEDMRLSDVKKRKMLRELFLPEIDIGEMAQRVLARHWEKYKDRREEFIAAFADFFERRFSEKMEMLKEARIVYGKEKIDGEYAEVGVRIVTTNQGEFSVTLKMRHNGKRWMIYDLQAFGKSAIGTYRDQINTVLSSGVTFEELLEGLRRGELKGRDRSWR